MRVITMYLPQFHRVPENDKWWGEGFTDWISAKNAQPLFEGHNQPHIPYNNYYYDLLQKETMQWQADNMREYGIDGQCIYHYWFKDGKQILEKPAENLLQWKDINMPYCFCWANETWARSWGNIEASNPWCDLYEPSNEDITEAILLEQKYGSKKEWEEHFLYLLPFFKDDRYIKVDDYPIFLIYKPNDIDRLDEMIESWQKLAKENGLCGVYFIGMAHNMYDTYPVSQSLDKILIHGPNCGLTERSEIKAETEPQRMSYEKVWNALLEIIINIDKDIYGGFINYDDTPRRGKKGKVITGYNKDILNRKLEELFAKNNVLGNDLIFINAWNEWGEGMYLEPDSCGGYEYLSIVKHAKDNYREYLPNYEKMIPFYKEISSLKAENSTLRETYEKLNEFYYICIDWITLKQNKVALSDYFKKNNIKTVAVYGLKELGVAFCRELSESDIIIEYIIDKNKTLKYEDIKVYSPSEDLPVVDMIIVTAVHYYDSIEKMISEHYNYKVTSLMDIISELARRK